MIRRSLPAHSPRLPLALAVAAGLAIGAFSLSGCDEMNRSRADMGNEADSPTMRQAPRQTGGRSATSREQQRRQYDQEAAELQAGLEEMNTRTAGGSRHAAEPEVTLDPVPREVLPASRRSAARAEQQYPQNVDTSPIPVRPARPEPLPALTSRTPDASANLTPEQRRADAVAELASQLKPDISGAKDPMRTALPIMGLELISPGSGVQYLDAIKRAVSPDQRRSLESTFALMKSLANDPNLTGGNPADTALALRAEADRLAGAVPAVDDTLSLGEVALCQRVDGFGRFTPLASNAFFAGRPAAMILYTEIENFSQVPAQDAAGGKWSVELGQTVRLYYDADDSEQMVLPETVVRDVSRSKRRDFFLVQRIDLPRTLTVGNYKLKVTVRDTGGGEAGANSSASLAGGAIVERIVPIRIIADASAAGPGSQRGTGSATTSPTTSSGSRRGAVTDRRP